MEKKFQYKNTEVCYKVTGNGPAVVLLHGFAEDSNIWQQQVVFLQSYCCLILPNLPGSGKSKMLQKDNVTIDDYAICINALLDNEGIEKCVLLGHSMGGYIALAFAELFAEKLVGFGFVHSSAFSDNAEKKDSRKKGMRIIGEQGAYPFIKSTTPNLFSKNFKNLHPEKIAALIENGRNFTSQALIQYYEAMMNRPDRTAILKESNVPVLFIIGSEDVAAPLADLLKQVYLPKISYIHIINRVGHMGMWEKADEVNNLLLAFITNV